MLLGLEVKNTNLHVHRVYLFRDSGHLEKGLEAGDGVNTDNRVEYILLLSKPIVGIFYRLKIIIRLNKLSFKINW
jgi:hypothetical protein